MIKIRETRGPFCSMPSCLQGTTSVSSVHGRFDLDIAHLINVVLPKESDDGNRISGFEDDVCEEVADKDMVIRKEMYLDKHLI